MTHVLLTYYVSYIHHKIPQKTHFDVNSPNLTRSTKREKKRFEFSYQNKCIKMFIGNLKVLTILMKSFD